MTDQALTVLIVYARFGEGHYQASTALEQQFAMQGQNEVHLVDIFEEAHPAMNALFRYLYAKSMTWFPKAYGWSYSVTNGMQHDGPLVRWLHALGRRKFTQILRTTKPDVIIHTFPFLAVYPVMEAFGISIPTYTVITDYDLHTRWVHPRTNGYFVGSDELKKQLMDRGIREDRIHVTGIPIRRQFRLGRSSRQEICREKGLDPDQNHVLVMVGALTNRMRLIEELLTLQPSANLLLVAGRDAKLYRRLMQRYADRADVQVIGFTDNLEDDMAIASCIVTKAGAITLTEAFAMRVPVVVYRPIPGQEQSNADYWENRHALRTARDASSVRSAVQQIITDRGVAEASVTGDASRAIVNEVLKADLAYARRYIPDF
ncbi:MGDG synthase family glycosyltransferase [Cohnella sp. JJ-181]|uniref:MGDG synthase family glycosyltransferase n=1 Tax=Cohnella rhizoplanae TaxID=2974897 RepID=UPI0022FF94BA|nr:glycosyltransferase [Cohnella sp. JJ-181]CAI6085565.1 Processive diacylglycerol beta-glucosyltransferase [Cohnella sp. JJ-181]